MTHRFSIVRRITSASLSGHRWCSPPPAPSFAQQASGGTLRVAVIADIANFDPHQFSSVNASLIKNLYDSLWRLTPDGKAIPSLTEILADHTRREVRYPVAAQGREVPLRRGPSTPRRWPRT